MNEEEGVTGRRVVVPDELNRSGSGIGGIQIKLTPSEQAAFKTGFDTPERLLQATLRYDAIHRCDECLVTKLLVGKGRCQGVVAIERAAGRLPAITARAVILFARQGISSHPSVDAGGSAGVVCSSKRRG